MGSRKRKLDVDGSPGSDYEPVSESWSKTEQYKVSYFYSAIGKNERISCERIPDYSVLLKNQ